MKKKPGRLITYSNIFHVDSGDTADGGKGSPSAVPDVNSPFAFNGGKAQTKSTDSNVEKSTTSSKR